MIDQDRPIHPRTSDAYGGITQRDWLAAMAMQGLMSQYNVEDINDSSPAWVELIPKAAYTIADAMIERSKQ